MRSLCILILTIICTTSAIPAPVKKLKPEEPMKPAPKREEILPLGETNWGRLEEHGDELILSGHPRWEATGFIRGDGKVQLIWTDLNSGELCPAVYEVRDGQLIGLWSYFREAVFGERGELVLIDPNGLLRDETIRRRPK